MFFGFLHQNFSHLELNVIKNGIAFLIIVVGNVRVTKSMSMWALFKNFEESAIKLKFYERHLKNNS